MAIYYLRDLEVDVKGDLVINEMGDLSLADPKDSCKHGLKFMVATDYGELASEPFFGSNVGTLVGVNDLNAVLDRLPSLVSDGVLRQGLMSSDDIRVLAVPIAPDQILLIVRAHGQFMDDNGEIHMDDEFTLKYLFPYKAARLVEITDD